MSEHLSQAQSRKLAKDSLDTTGKIIAHEQEQFLRSTQEQLRYYEYWKHQEDVGRIVFSTAGIFIVSLICWGIAGIYIINYGKPWKKKVITVLDLLITFTWVIGIPANLLVQLCEAFGRFVVIVSKIKVWKRA